MIVCMCGVCVLGLIVPLVCGRVNGLRYCTGCHFCASSGCVLWSLCVCVCRYKCMCTGQMDMA